MPRRTPAATPVVATRWVALVGLVTLATGAACGSSENAASSVQPLAECPTIPSIYGGDPAFDSARTRPVVALRIAANDGDKLCSGTLVAPNVVLTARHCVSAELTKSVTCAEDGSSLEGDHVGDDYDPSVIEVHAGVAPDLYGEPVAIGKASFHPTGKNLCNADIALLVLDRAVGGVTPATVRMTAPAASGEKLEVIGYGENDRGCPAGTRFERESVTIVSVGIGRSPSGKHLGEHEIESDRAFCQGDSGGPAFDATTGAIVGVVTRGGDCKANLGHVYTLPSGFPAVFAKAFAAAGAGGSGGPALEAAGSSVPSGKPPTHAFESACTLSGECDSNVCTIQGSSAYCSRGCQYEGDCPTGYRCAASTNDAAVRSCVVATNAAGAQVAPGAEEGRGVPGLDRPSSSGCSIGSMRACVDASARDTSGGTGMSCCAGLVMVALSALRRKRTPLRARS